MYLLSILLLMVVCISYTIVASGSNIVYYLDPVSLVILFLLVIPILISSGLLKDFNNAFRLGIKRKTECSRIELLRAIEAVNLAVRAFWVSGIFNSVFAFVHIFASLDGEILIRSVSVSLITLVYAAFCVILLLPLRARLAVRLHEITETAKPDQQTLENGK